MRGSRLLLIPRRCIAGDAKNSTEKLFGIIPVRLALENPRRYPLKVYSSREKFNYDGKHARLMEEIVDICLERNVPIVETSKHDLNVMCGNRPHQGFIMDTTPLAATTIREMPSNVRSKVILALDEVTDPMNLGSILRSSYFFGCRELLISSRNSAPLSAVVSRASAGALELMDVYSVLNMATFLKTASEQGYQIIGTALTDRSIPLEDLRLTKPCIVVFGNEGSGLRQNVISRCDDVVRIGAPPGVVRPHHLIDSLNVGVAAGVIVQGIASKAFES